MVFDPGIKARGSTLQEDLRGAKSGPWVLGAFFGIQILLAALLFAVELPRLQGDLELLLFLLALNVAAELMPIGVYGDSYTTVGFVLTVSLIILFGAPAVVLAGPLEGVAGRVGRRNLDYKAFTNGCRFVVVNWIAAKAFEAVAGERPSQITVEVAAGVAVSCALYFVLSYGFIAASTSLKTGAKLKSVFAQHLWLLPQQSAMAVLGLALAAAVISPLGILGAVAFVTPALMTRFAIKQYTDKTRENVQKLTQQNLALQRANVEIKSMGDELKESYDGTLEALVNALDARDQETKGHSLRVSHYMMDIARQLGVVPETKSWTDMQRGSLLHDVGKIGVSDTILLKPSKLTDEEWSHMRKHPEIGYNMLKQVKFLEGAAEIVLAHHERWDGKGYPYGLHEDEIPLGARIFTVVDTFDSMTSDRPYRKALSTMEALNEILKYGGTQFDPMVVEAFLDTYEKWVRERDSLQELTAVRRVAA
jgi:putative nucleotidyltransferase with HDIG domain